MTIPMTEDTTKHLEFVQGVIARMGSNSFLLKGWTVTLTSALFALAAKDARPLFVLVALFPALSFWGLDAYYLRQERLFRKLYDDLRLMAQDRSRKVDPYSLSTEPYRKDVAGWFWTLWATTVIAVHGIVLVTILTVLIVAFCVR